MSDTRDAYLATDRMPVSELAVDVRVFVPEWKSGRVVGWVHGVIIDVQVPTPTPGIVAPGPNDTFYVVRLDSGDERGYFAWSVGRPQE